ncbi:MAG: ArsR/SmtB family transcription factor [Pirellulales bacterium]
MKANEEFDDCATRLKALADPDRLKIITRLFKGGKNVGDIAQELGEEVVNVSHHLGVLRHAGFVKTEKQGRFVVYSLHPDVIAVEQPNQPLLIDLGCCCVNLGPGGSRRAKS